MHDHDGLLHSAPLYLVFRNVPRRPKAERGNGGPSDARRNAALDRAGYRVLRIEAGLVMRVLDTVWPFSGDVWTSTALASAVLRRLSTRLCLLIATSLAACGTSARIGPPDSTSGGSSFAGSGSLLHAGQSGALSGGGADNAGQAGSGEAGIAEGGADDCGDGVLSPSETCDDGNLVPNDGCSARCRPERGYVCTGEPSDCRTICGDGIVAGNESCDDGNQSNADSCINDCQRPILSVGGAVSCVLLDGTAKCWGAASAGQLGSGSFGAGPQSVPISVQGLRNGVQIASSSDENCALLGDGSVSCWGNGSYGQLGNGQHYAEGGTDPAAQGVALPTPTLQTPHVLQIGTSGQTACALNTDGTVDCWGDNRSGQVGIGRFEPNEVAYHWAPERVVELDHVSQIAVGGHHACALISDGSVRCWGNGFEGELGDGQSYDADPWGQASPVSVRSLNDAIQVASKIPSARLGSIEVRPVVDFSTQ